jgi:hypothetical protein
VSTAVYDYDMGSHIFDEMGLTYVGRAYAKRRDSGHGSQEERYDFLCLWGTGEE